MHGIDVHLKMQNNITPVELARNLLMTDFTNSAHNYLLMIDDDIGFNWEHVKTLMDANLEVVSGIYPRKSFSLSLTCIPLDRRVSTTQPGRNHGVVPCYGVPGGFLLLKRSAVQRVEAHLRAIGDPHGVFAHYVYHRYFRTDFSLENNTIISEYYAFSNLLREVGITPYSHFGVILQHFGAHAYAFDHQNAAMAQAAAIAQMPPGAAARFRS